MKIQPVFSEKERRNWIIILVTFPIGGILSLFNAASVFGRGETAAGWVSVFFGVVILLLFGIAAFNKYALHQVQLAFFSLLAFYLFLMTINTVNEFSLRGNSGDTVFRSEFNGISLWISILFISAYLSVSNKQANAFVFFSLGGFLTAFLYHLIFKDGLNSFVVLMWLRNFFPVFVLALLITQTGRLHHEHATRDDLTEALNRRETYQVLNRELLQAARYQKTFSIILFDVDHFKNINDTYGHLMGDNVLKGVSKVVRQTIRKTDELGRWGGEEFLVILPNSDLIDAKRLAERLREAIFQHPFGTRNHVTASFGVVVYQQGQDLENLLHAADQAMYKAKESGRNRVIPYIYDDSIS
ncbi:MAG: GGDEF domain-containing protein [Anaerolineales bacterium]|nr:GGDEF domain-containing protein [Anaerolineales bacterium]MCB9145170.1 GGDEF domain-containing protein [Anaerolineales bacterium]